MYNMLISLNKEIEHRSSLVFSVVHEVRGVVQHVVSEDSSLFGPENEGWPETEGESTAP